MQVGHNGVFYQGIDLASWIFLFEVPCLCLPGTCIALSRYFKLKKEALKKA